MKRTRSALLIVGVVAGLILLAGSIVRHAPPAAPQISPAPLEKNVAAATPAVTRASLWQGFVADVRDLTSFVEGRRPELLSGSAQALEDQGDHYAFGSPDYDVAREKDPVTIPVGGHLPKAYEDGLCVSWRGHAMQVRPLFGRGQAEPIEHAIAYRLGGGITVVSAPLHDRVEELVVLERTDRLPDLAYELTPDSTVTDVKVTPAGSVELWSEEAPFLRLNPVEAMDANRKKIRGAWEIERRSETWIARAKVDLSDAAFPVAVDPGWSSTGGMLENTRSDHTATRLYDGRVLVAGGTTSWGSYLSSCELYHPASGTWSATGNLGIGRYGHRTVLMPSGKALLVGGYGNQGGLSSCEIYNPTTGVWSTTGSMGAGRYDHTLTLLPTGKVLAAGGTSTASCELYDPIQGAWSPTGLMSTSRTRHAAVLVPSGKVLVSGGDTVGVALPSCELYDPVSGSWSATGSLPDVRRDHDMQVLASGQVFLAGGESSTWYGYGNTPSCLLYTPAIETWTNAASMPEVLNNYSVSLLLSGKILAVGWSGANGFPPRSHLYDPTSDTWSATDSPTWTVVSHTATPLPSGKVLIASGSVSALYEPMAVSVPSDLSQHHSTGAALAVGETANSSTVLFRGVVSHPTGGTVQLQVEVRTAGESFTETPTASSSSVASGAQATVTVADLANGSYHWRARARTAQGQLSPWTQFYVGSPSFIVAVDYPPSVSAPAQYDGSSELATGATVSSILVLKAMVADLNGDPARLQVEIQPVGTPFANTPTATSGWFASGTQADVTVSGLPSGRYHWQARAAGGSSNFSAWVSFGGNSETAADFVAGGAFGYATSFDTLPPGWTLDAPMGGVSWGIDDTPLSGLSAPRSLNYNNGTDYRSLGNSRNTGSATSMAVDLSGMRNPQLAFACLYQTETAGTAYDKRFVRVSNNGFATPLLDRQLSSTSGGCADTGTWHQHVIELEPSWGNVQVRFRFDSIDGTSNAFAGWFIDDFAIREEAAPLPPAGALYQTDFGGTAGWTFSTPTANGVGWAMRANALQYNNGTNYDSGSPNAGSATSPAIGLSGSASPKLRFRCKYRTETTGTSWDKRWLHISKDGFTTQVLQRQFSSTSGGCGAMGAWHTHEINLDPAWGTINVRFFFDTVDGTSNNHEGWLIDDVVVQQQ
ncbi:MAG: hypothetical protein HYY16_08945 [Planctomycetes bacterium]|nr:hypothetical protein [Planctomycetota bacterium]